MHHYTMYAAYLVSDFNIWLCSGHSYLGFSYLNVVTDVEAVISTSFPNVYMCACRMTTTPQSSCIGENSGQY